MQRTGTTSVGNFFSHFGFSVSRWSDSKKSQWSKLWYEGDLESIFKSDYFKSTQLFEDGPWWFPDFYKILYHRFPNSKFILFTRDSESWFKSMLSHSNGQTLGNTKIHSKVYRREKEFYEALETNNNSKLLKDNSQIKLSLIGFEQHYRNLYEIRNKEIIAFFEKHNPNRLIHCDLSDVNKWQKLGSFLKIDVPKNFEVHSNKSLN